MDYCVSVIIPMYNRAHVVSRALESVFRQSLKEIEILVVDDGSTDGCTAIVRNYQKEYPNLFLFETAHEGPGPARNVGIKNARGKYIAFLESDDFVPERAYELLYRAAEENECDFVVGQFTRRSVTENQGRWSVPERTAQVIRGYVGKNCAGNYDIPLRNPAIWNRLIRRDFILRHDLLYGKEIFGEDMTYNLKLFGAAEKATAIDEIVYCYEPNYSDAGSAASTMALEPVLSGMRSVDSYALFFDSMGRIDWEIEALLGSFAYVLEQFYHLSEKDKAVAFEEIKKYLKRYQGRREYAIPISYLMGMELDTLLLLPYPAYETCKGLIPAISAVPDEVRTVYTPEPGGDPRETVLALYLEGKAGLRYIWKYFMAWLRYKLKSKA